MKQIKYPIGIQTFEKLREGDFLYIDKTDLIYSMIANEGYYFLSRPRRFGKSLLLSTIKAFFEGKRELFKNLDIDRLTDNWEPHPILHLDFNNGEYDSPNGLERRLNKILTDMEDVYGRGRGEDDSSSRFEGIIQRAYKTTGKKVVILIDEYDKPLLASLSNEELRERFRTQLKTLYSNLKTQDQYIHFAMLTGVARFSKLSVFSDLNNLRDISFEEDFSTICGVTADELDNYFKPSIENLSSRLKISECELYNQLKERYDGYHFSANSPDIYNPYSLMKVFASSELDNFWAESGTPSFLAEMIVNSDLDIRDMNNLYYPAPLLKTSGIMSIDPEPILYQTGYLTIKGYNGETRDYRLGYPNSEVEESFLNFLMPMYIGKEENRDFSINRFKKDILTNNTESFMTRLSSLVASLPYTNNQRSLETRFQDVVYMVFSFVGFFARTEIHTSEGRIDTVIETSRDIYIFEFKINSKAEEAMNQIMDRHYWRPYESSGKSIHLIGATFDTKTRVLLEWQMKTVNKSGS